MTTTTADTLGAIVEKDRDRRELAWLRAQVGDDAIREAVAHLPGQRRPYVLNIARALGLVLPAPLAADPEPRADRRQA